MNEFQGCKITDGSLRDIHNFLLEVFEDTDVGDIIYRARDIGCTIKYCGTGVECNECLLSNFNRRIYVKYIQWQLRRIRYERTGSTEVPS